MDITLMFIKSKIERLKVNPQAGGIARGLLARIGRAFLIADHSGFAVAGYCL